MALPADVESCYHYHMCANVIVRAKPTVSESCAIPCFKQGLVKKLQEEMPQDEALEDMRAVFAALADKARLKILYSLKDGQELCVCDVAHVVGTTVSTASHHLRKLRDLKLLKYRNDGKMAYYSLKSEIAAQLVREALKSVGRKK